MGADCTEQYTDCVLARYEETFQVEHVKCNIEKSVVTSKSVRPR